MKKVSNVLREYFRQQGLTQKTVAEKLSLNQPVISRYLNDQYKFNKATAEKWANTFGFSESFLITGEGYLFGNSEQPLFLMNEVDKDIKSSIQPDSKEYWKQRCNELILENTQLKGKIEGLQLAISSLRLKTTE